MLPHFPGCVMGKWKDMIRSRSLLARAIVPMAFALAILAPGLPAYAASPQPASTPTVVDTNKGALPAWIVAANPYVHVANERC